MKFINLKNGDGIDLDVVESITCRLKYPPLTKPGDLYIASRVSLTFGANRIDIDFLTDAEAIEYRNELCRRKIGEII